MIESKEQLIKLFKEAKQRRIVLNQTEFANLVGYSRIHLFKKMNEIPKSILDKAEKLLETNDVPNETTVKRKASVDDELNRLIELSIKHEAEIEVLRLLIVNILAVQRGKEFPSVEEEVIQAMRMRSDRLFDEYSKKK